MAVRRFEEIVAWQVARQLVKEIYALTRKQPFVRDTALCNQIQRAAVSTMSNIAEGFERESSRDFLHFLSIARASNAEVRSLLYVALDAECVDVANFKQVMATAQETSRLVSSFRKSIDDRVNAIKEEPGAYIIDLSEPGAPDQ